jgi:hypothetical protein
VENPAKPDYRPSMPRLVIGIASLTILEGVLGLLVLDIAATPGFWLPEPKFT